MQTQIVNLSPNDNTLDFHPGYTIFALCDATDGAFTVLLPDAKGRRAGDDVIFVKTDSSSNTVTVGTKNNQTINGAATLSLDAQYKTRTVRSDRSNYLTVGGLVEIDDLFSGTEDSVLFIGADGTPTEDAGNFTYDPDTGLLTTPELRITGQVSGVLQTDADGDVSAGTVTGDQMSGFTEKYVAIGTPAGGLESSQFLFDNSESEDPGTSGTGVNISDTSLGLTQVDSESTGRERVVYCDGIDVVVSVDQADTEKIRSFTIDANGQLTDTTNTLTIYSGERVQDLYWDGSYLFAIVDRRIQAVGVGANGSLTPIYWHSFPTEGRGVTGDGTYIYVMCSTGNPEIRPFEFNGSVLTAKTTLDLSSANAVICDTVNNYKIVAYGAGDVTVRAYTFNGTTWSQVGNELELTGYGVDVDAPSGAFDGTYYHLFCQSGGIYGTAALSFDGTDFTLHDFESLASASGDFGQVSYWTSENLVACTVGEELAVYTFNGASYTTVDALTLAGSGVNGNGAYLVAGSATSIYSLEYIRDDQRAFTLKHTTGDDMGDGFGVGMQFAIEDDAGTENLLYGIKAVRNGADNTGDLVFFSKVDTTETERVTFDKDGNVRFHAYGAGTLQTDVSGNITAGTVPGSGLSGFTENIVPVGSAAGGLEDGIITDDGSGVSVAGTFAATGAIQFSNYGAGVLQSDASGNVSSSTVPGSSLSGFTDTAIPVGQADGSLADSSILTDDGSTLVNTGALTTAPKLTVTDSATTAPLNITARSAAPSSPATHDIYPDDGTNTASGLPGWRRYTGAAWEDMAAVSGTPGGADTNVQYNDSGAFGGDANFTYDKAGTVYAGTQFNAGSYYQIGGSTVLSIDGTESTWLGVSTSGVGNYCTAAGERALANNSGNYNTCVGGGAGRYLGSGTRNTMLGFEAGRGNAGGHNSNDNTGFGYRVLANLSSGTGNNNTAIGNFALNRLQSGSSNVAIGFNSMFFATTITNCVCIGTQSGYNLTTGSGGNVAIGYFAMSNATSVSDCFAIGRQALSRNTGNDNFGAGNYAGFYQQGGTKNCYLGTNAGRNISNYTASSQLLIGYNSGYYETGSDTFMLANDTTGTEAGDRTHALLYGLFEDHASGPMLRTNCAREHQTTRITDADSPYSVVAGDHEIFCDTDGGAITVNLPAGTNGRNLRIINCGSSGNRVTVAPNGAELLIGSNSSSTLSDGSVIILTYETTEGWW